MTPPVTISVPLASFSTHRPLVPGMNLCSAAVLLSVSVRLPLLSTLITLPLPVICSTLPFKSSVSGAVDGQGTADVNVRRQLDGADSRIGNRISQAQTRC